MNFLYQIVNELQKNAVNAVDLFREYISATNPLYQGKPLKDIEFELLTRLTPMDIEEYLEYLKLYTNKEGKEITNNERGIKRKLSSLRTFYRYFHANRMIDDESITVEDDEDE